MTGEEQICGRIKNLDAEISEMRMQKQIALGVSDIQERYGVCTVTAYKIIRAIKHVCGGGKLPSGKVLPCEVLRWEQMPKEHFVQRDTSPDWGNPFHNEVLPVRAEKEEKVKSKFIKVYIKEPGESVHSEVIPNELEALQEVVGGYIETVTMFCDMTIVCNEEGRMRGLPYNCKICGMDFFGTVFFVGVREDEFCDVPIKFDQFKKIFCSLCE